MAAYCTWNSCVETEHNSFVVKFSNGRVKHPDKLKFQIFKNSDEVNPRKKSRRILAAESDRLLYVGSNFGSGSSQCNSVCRYYVGVLDKNTMHIHGAQMLNMQPVISGESVAEDSALKPVEKYRDKVDSLIEAFGTNKQKRALNSRRLNKVGEEALQQAVERAASAVITEKGAETLLRQVAHTEAQADVALFLPHMNTEAQKPQDVFPFEQLLSPQEFESLDEVGARMADLPREELQSPQTVIQLLDTRPRDGEAGVRLWRCAWYLSFLIRVSREMFISRKYDHENGCPRLIIKKVLENFTVESFRNGSVKFRVSVTMKMKLAAHSLALLLHMGDQTADLTLLHRDLDISEAKMLELAKAMGLTLGRLSVTEAGEQNQHRSASLLLPLARHPSRNAKRKRR